MLDGAYLQGALLDSAQLQGVSFSGAYLKGTNLTNAYLWRSYVAAGPPRMLSAIQMTETDKTWTPWWQDSMRQDQAWDDKNDDKNAYKKLGTSLQSLPSGPLRTAALQRFEVLNPALAPPTEAAAWKNAVMMQVVLVQPYHNALAESLMALFCPGDENEVLVVRTVAKFGQLQNAGNAAGAIIAELLNKDSRDCPVAASLTDADRATLLNIKQKIISAEEPGLANPP